jgi:hypothetical protein
VLLLTQNTAALKMEGAASQAQGQLLFHKIDPATRSPLAGLTLTFSNWLLIESMLKMHARWKRMHEG